jgi:hypothetical protein
LDGEATMVVFSANEDWLREQTDMLLQRCPFVPAKDEPFILAPNEYDKPPIMQDRVRALLRRLRLSYDSISIFIHANMKEPGKVVLIKKHDTRAVQLKRGEELISVESDGTYTIRDKFHPDGPKRMKRTDKLPTLTSLSMYLNQAYCADDLMGAIVAHEVAHLYLHAHNVQSLNVAHTRAMERTTDIAAFVIGLGDLYLRGLGWDKQIRVDDKRYDITLGYLTLSEMTFVHQYVLRSR